MAGHTKSTTHSDVFLISRAYSELSVFLIFNICRIVNTLCTIRPIFVDWCFIYIAKLPAFFAKCCLTANMSNHCISFMHSRNGGADRLKIALPPLPRSSLRSVTHRFDAKGAV